MRKLSREELINSRPTLEEVKKQPRNPVSVVLNDIRSLYNVGAIFRISDAANIEKLYLCGITGKPPNKEIEKTALRTIDSVRWEYRVLAVDIVKELKAKGYQIVALELTDESININQADFKFPVCLILGNEVEGVTQDLLDLSDMVVKISMLGLANSLNVATAYGVAIYGIIKQYQITL